MIVDVVNFGEEATPPTMCVCLCWCYDASSTHSPVSRSGHQFNLYIVIMTRFVCIGKFSKCGHVDRDPSNDVQVEQNFLDMTSYHSESEKVWHQSSRGWCPSPHLEGAEKRGICTSSWRLGTCKKHQLTQMWETGKSVLIRIVQPFAPSCPPSLTAGL